MFIKQFGKGVEIINKIFMYLCVALLIITVLSCAIQVISRHVTFITVLGMEEAARIAFVWMSFLGASLGVASFSHPSITLLSGRIPAKLVPWYRIFLQITIIIFSAILFKHGLIKADKVAEQISPSFSVNMKLIYSSITIGCAGMIVNAINNILTTLDQMIQRKMEV